MKKRKRLIYLVPILLLLIGIGLIAYPLISNRLAENRQSAVQVQYNETVETLDDMKLLEALKAAQAYNESLYRIQIGQEETVVTPYDDLLNLSGNGVMGYVEIPDIDITLPIYHGVSEESLAKGAGHLPETSLPIGGESTHAVISAHSGMASARMFTDLEQLKEGDVFFLHVLNDTLAYEIDQILTVLPSDTEAIQIVPGEDYVTLLTCVPYGVNTHRLLVRGHRIELSKEDILAEETTDDPENSMWMQKYLESIIAGLIITLCVLLLLLLILLIRKKKSGKSKS